MQYTPSNINITSTFYIIAN